MNNKSLIVTKTNFCNLKLAYIITAFAVASTVVQDVVFAILYAFGTDTGAGQGMMGLGNMLYIFVILSAVFIPSLHFRKMMNLGCKRGGFFTGCAATYAILAAAVSLASIVSYYTYEKFFMSYYDGGWTLNLAYWFGWLGNGVIVAFFQQFAFLLLISVIIHTLTAAQGKWYGYIADVVIVAIISVFTPIAPLRGALVRFFSLIIFETAPLQITVCLVLALLIYWLNKPIFARKAI